MALQPIIIAFSKQFDKSGDPTKPGNIQVTANAYLYLPEEIIDYYNIPKPTEVGAAIARKTVAEYTYKRFANFADTVGKEVVVPEYEATVGSGADVFKVARIAHGSAKTSKGRFRTCSIRFPSFFTIIMIGQALGTMIQKDRPSSWKLDQTGRSYPLVPSTAGVPAGYKSGAWVVTAPVAVVGAETSESVAETTVVKGKAQPKTAAATP